MIVIFKKNGNRSADAWFEENPNIKNLKVNTITIHGTSQVFDASNCVALPQKSLITDLTISIDSLPIAKNTKYEIRRAQKENIEIMEYTSEDVLSNRDGILDVYENLYTTMYQEKGFLDKVLPRDEIITYCRANACVVTGCKINGEIRIVHSYIVDPNNCRLLNSCSSFRNGDQNDRNIIGRANKYLHFCDLQMFKKRGVKKYDWGGVSDFTNPNGIDKFKMSFGGEQIEYYNAVVYISTFSKLKLFIKRLLERYKR